MDKKPKIYTVLLIVGIIAIVIGVVLIVLGVAVLPTTFNGNAVSPNPALFAPGMIVAAGGVAMLIYSCIPKMQKQLIKTVRYVQEENKEDLTVIANNAADISGEAIKTTVKNVKEGLTETKYCKYCGEVIDSDSIFCNKCGKKQ